MKRLLLPLLLSALVISAAPAPGPLQVVDPWVRESNPATNVTAGYGTLVNPGNRAIAVRKASSPAARVVELHEMRTVDGVMSMRRVDTITVPARGKVMLQPGGLHLMLIGVEKPLRAGEMVTITLELGDGSRVDMLCPVKNPNQTQHAH